MQSKLQKLITVLLSLILISCGKSEEEIVAKRELESIIRQLNTQTKFYNQNTLFAEKTKTFNELYDYYYEVEKSITELKLESDKIHSYEKLNPIKNGLETFLDSLSASIVKRKGIINLLKENLEEYDRRSFDYQSVDFEKTKRTAFLYQESLAEINMMQTEINKALIEEDFSDTLIINPSFNFDWLVLQIESFDNSLSRFKALEEERESILQRARERKKIEEAQITKAKEQERLRLEQISKENLKVFKSNQTTGVFNFKTLYEDKPYLRKYLKITNYLSSRDWEIDQDGQSITLPWATVADALGEELTKELVKFYQGRSK
uniref:hypothetical protein n=1 Tax=Roseivirga sp. TaxID=1964215 RepID=UPI004048D4CD